MAISSGSTLSSTSYLSISAMQSAILGEYSLAILASRLLITWLEGSTFIDQGVVFLVVAIAGRLQGAELE